MKSQSHNYDDEFGNKFQVFSNQEGDHYYIDESNLRVLCSIESGKVVSFLQKF